MISCRLAANSVRGAVGLVLRLLPLHFEGDALRGQHLPLAAQRGVRFLDALLLGPQFLFLFADFAGLSIQLRRPRPQLLPGQVQTRIGELPVLLGGPQ